MRNTAGSLMETRQRFKKDPCRKAALDYIYCKEAGITRCSPLYAKWLVCNIRKLRAGEKNVDHKPKEREPIEK